MELGGRTQAGYCKVSSAGRGNLPREWRTLVSGCTVGNKSGGSWLQTNTAHVFYYLSVGEFTLIGALVDREWEKTTMVWLCLD